MRALGATPELQRVIREIPDSRSRLAYGGEMTEKAAHRVLNLVDAAMPQVSAHAQRAQQVVTLLEQQTQALPGDAQGQRCLAAVRGEFPSNSVGFAAQQKQILSDILLTQDFQDLSGEDQIETVVQLAVVLAARFESAGRLELGDDEKRIAREGSVVMDLLAETVDLDLVAAVSEWSREEISRLRG